MGVANCAERDRHEPVCIHHSTLTTQHSNGTNTLEEYVYDYMGRRIAKETTTHATEDEEYRVFFYHGWNVAAEYTTDSSWANEDLDFTYTWGLDVTGSLQGAGGVGGLLVAEKVSTGNTGEYYPTYDGNGNVSEYIDSSGAQVAHYEYDPFGNELSLSSGTLKDLFNFKFSTKYEDKETGFYYYGYRYYDPVVGRWIRRDPIEEFGGLNLYGFVWNDGVNDIDILGLRPPKIVTDTNKKFPNGIPINGKAVVIGDDNGKVSKQTPMTGLDVEILLWYMTQATHPVNVLREGPPPSQPRRTPARGPDLYIDASRVGITGHDIVDELENLGYVDLVCGPCTSDEPIEVDMNAEATTKHIWGVGRVGLNVKGKIKSNSRPYGSGGNTLHEWEFKGHASIGSELFDAQANDAARTPAGEEAARVGRFLQALTGIPFMIHFTGDVDVEVKGICP